MYKPEISELIKGTPKGDYRNGVYYWWMNVDTPVSQHLFLLAGTHGQEFACPLALVELLKKPWRWPNVSACCVIQDPKGYADEGYGFISPNGEGSCWPPLWRYPMNDELYWFYMDENSAWGNNVNVPPRHQQMRGLMNDLPPTFVLSLHETIRSEVKRDLFWAGAGLLLIEVYPMSLTEYGGVLDTIGSPGANTFTWAVNTLREWLSPLWKERRWRRSRKALQNNDGFNLVSKIVEQYEREYGMRLTGDAWTRYQEAMDEPTVGSGRIIHGPSMLQSEWRTATDYAVGKYGCPAITTESFPCAEVGLRGLDQRVEQQLAFIEATLDILNDKDRQV
jgi:hypothetical protein